LDYLYLIAAGNPWRSFFFLSVLLLPVFKSLGLANIFHLSILFRFSQLEDGTSIGLFFLFFFKNSTDFSFQEKKIIECLSDRFVSSFFPLFGYISLTRVNIFRADLIGYCVFRPYKYIDCMQ